MFKTIRSITITGAFALMANSALAQDIVFSGVSTTSDDYQLGVVWSGIVREAGISMTVVENGTVSGMRKAAQGEIDMVGVGAPHYLDAVGGTGNRQLLCHKNTGTRPADKQLVRPRRRGGRSAVGCGEYPVRLWT